MADDRTGWLREQVEAFAAVRPTYVAMAKLLRVLLDHAVAERAPLAIVEARAKSVSSFAEKALRKRNQYPDPVNQMTDLCGARVIVETTQGIEPLCEYIRGAFEVDESRSQDVLERLGPGEFGYRSVHFIVSLKPDTFDRIRDGLSPKDGAALKELEPALLDRRYSKETGLRAPAYRAEIQVRTLLQHAWATASHDHAYKGSFELPWQWQRDAARVAAVLEEADGALTRFVSRVVAHKTAYGAYMTPEQIEEELGTLEAVRCYDERNERLAVRTALLHIELRQYAKAATLLEPFRTSDNGQTLRILAGALLRTGRPEGRAVLARALEISPSDPETLCDLAEVWLQDCPPEDPHCNWQACSHFLRAYQSAPHNPRALAGFIQTKIRCDGNAEFIPLLTPSLEEAIEHLHSSASLGLGLPDAYYEIGHFHLLMGQRNPGLCALAKAAQLSVSEAPIQASRAFLDRIRRALANASPDRARDFAIADRFLAAAEVAKLVERADRAQRHARATEGELAQAHLALEAAADDDQRSAALQTVERSQAARASALAAVREMEQQADAAREDRLRGLATEQPPLTSQRVVIVAGGCDERFAQRIDDFAILLEDALEGFTGVVCCGGTTAGISGIVAKLPSPSRKIAYLPREAPSEAAWVPHEAYEVRYTDGPDISELEPIQNWIDLLVSGVRPSDVKLLGINGGAIAAFEFRLALALGAMVGVLCDSGRAASRLAEDPEWEEAPHLARLPSDTQSLRAFLGYGTPSAFTSRDRDAMGCAYHMGFLERHPWASELDPALASWEELREDLRESNRLAADYIQAILATVGLGVRKAAGWEPVIMNFTDTEIETMAEAEHGRWVVERKLAGWTLGERDLVKRTSPYLVSWADLPDAARDWDREAAKRIPHVLAVAGYEVCRP